MNTIWRDGRLVRNGVRRDGPGAGWGVFTTVGCDGGRPLLWPWHSERLAASLSRLGAADDIRLPDEDALRRLLASEDLEGPARARVVGRAGIDSLWTVIATASALDESGPTLPPCRLIIQRWPGVPSMVGHKMLNREKWDVAREGALKRGADDALLVDASGRVLETSIANIWVRHNDAVLTPTAPDCCLPGVMRKWLLEKFDSMNLEVRECDLGVDDVAAADEVLVSNAVVGVRRVSRVVDRRWSAWPLFDRLIESDVPAPGWS